MGVYKIQRGDNGESIAKAHGLSYAQLLAANPGVNWFELIPESYLHIPSNKTAQYEIKKGDIGLSIAGKYGIPFATLENLNPGTNWHHLEPGKTLTVPQSGTLLKESVGAPISGVPAQMPAPTTNQAQTMPNETRKKVAGLLSIPEDDAVFSKVGSLDWPGCYSYIRLRITGKESQPAGGPNLAVVDLRNPDNRESLNQFIHI